MSLAASGLVLAGLAGGCNTAGFRNAFDNVNGCPDQERRFNLNSATRDQLGALPGLTDEDADRIIANRPYHVERDLLHERVLNEGKYDQIKSYVYVYSARGN
jgi:DNA uptake protein ComE-like DNA-binding protein